MVRSGSELFFSPILERVRLPGGLPALLRGDVMTLVPRGLLVALMLAILTMAIGFWLKWRIISPFEPESWYLESTSQFAYTDIIGVYIERGVADHPLPYLEMALEYPPVTGIVIYLTSFAPGPTGYLVANYSILALAGLGTIWTAHLLRRRARLWVLAATPPLALYAGLNWDLLPIFFAVAALALFERKRDGWAAAALAMGVWAKLFPVLLLPALVIERVGERNWRSLAGMGAAFGLVSLMVNLPFALFGFSEWRYFFDFHSSRAPDAGSIWSQVGQLPVSLVNGASLAVVAAGLVAISMAGTRTPGTATEQGLGILALFVLASKASSPQYNLWLMPFLALLSTPLWLIGLFLIADLTYYTFSFYALFLAWGGQSPLAETVVAAAGPIVAGRHLALLLVFLWATIRLLRRPAGDDKLT